MCSARVIAHPTHHPPNKKHGLAKADEVLCCLSGKLDSYNNFWSNPISTPLRLASLAPWFTNVLHLSLRVQSLEVETNFPLSCTWCDENLQISYHRIPFCGKKNHQSPDIDVLWDQSFSPKLWLDTSCAFYMGVSVNGGTPKTPQNGHF